MLYLLNWRLWVAAALALSIIGAYVKGRSDGKSLVRAEVAQAQAVAAENARLRERALQKGVDDAARDAAARSARILSDAADARRSADGLRDELDVARSYAAQSRAAAERIAGVTSELLESCTRAYVAVAEAADRSDSEARTLRQAWPR